MKSGDVVKINKFKFLDGFLDVEGYNRRCIVLYIEDEKVCVCPITSQINSFNKNPERYYFLPFTNKKGKKLTFAKLSSVVYIDKKDVLEKIDYLDNDSLIRLIDKLKQNYEIYNFNNEYFSDTVNKIERKTLVK